MCAWQIEISVMMRVHLSQPWRYFRALFLVNAVRFRDRRGHFYIRKRPVLVQERSLYFDATLAIKEKIFDVVLLVRRQISQFKCGRVVLNW